MLVIFLSFFILKTVTPSEWQFYLPQRPFNDKDALLIPDESTNILQSNRTNDDNVDTPKLKLENARPSSSRLEDLRYGSSIFIEGQTRETIGVLSTFHSLEILQKKNSCTKFLCYNEDEVCINVLENSSLNCTNLVSLVTSALVFPYQSFTTSGINQENLIALAKGNHIGFYYDKDSHLVPAQVVLEFEEEIASLQIIQDFDATSLSSKRYLIAFLKSGTVKIAQIDVDSRTDAIILGHIIEWNKDGDQTRIFYAGGKLLLAQLQNNQLHIYNIGIKEVLLTSNKVYTLNSGLSIRFWLYSPAKDLVLLFSGKTAEVYTMHKDKFVLIQTLKANSQEDFQEAFSFKTLDTLQEFLLIRTSDVVKIYRFDSNFEKFSLVTTKFVATKKVWISKTSTEQLSLVMETEDSVLIKQLELKNEDDSLLNLELMRKIRSLKNEKDRISSEHKKISEKLDRSIGNQRTIRGDIQINGYPEFRKPISIQAIQGAVDEEAFWLYKQELRDLSTRILEIKSSIYARMKTIQDCVPLSGPTRAIRGEKYFFGIKTSFKELVANKAFISPSKEEDHQEGIVDVLINLVRKNDQRQVKGRKSFTGTVTVDNLWTISLNGIKTSKLVVADDNSELQDLTFVNKLKVREDITVGNSVNHIDLSEKAVLLNGNHSLGRCKFNKVDAKSGIHVRSHIVNGKNFTEEAKSLIQIGPKTVLSTTIFGNISVAGDLNAKNVMDVYFNEFLSDVIFRKESSRRSSTLKHIEFLSLVKCQNMIVDGNINGETFPQDFVHKEKVVYFGQKYFNEAYFDVVHVQGFVDNIKVSDIVTRTTPQTISSRKTFLAGIRVLGNLDINSGMLDGIDLKLLFKKFENSQEANQILLFEDDFTVSNLTLKGKINGIDIKSIADDLVYKDEPNSIINGRKTFTSMNVKNAHTKDDINGIDTNTFVITTSPAMINSVKVFEDDVVFTDLIVTTGLINRTNINTLFEDSLYVDKRNQIVDGRKSFVHLTAEQLAIEKLNNIEMDAYLTKSTDQTFTDRFTIFDGHFSFVKGNSINVMDGKINKINVRGYEKQLSSASSLDEHVTVHGDVYVKKLKSNTLNSIQIKDLLDLAQKDESLNLIKKQVILDSLKITGSLTTKDQTLKEIAQNAINTTDINVFDSTSFNSIRVNEITVKGLVNGLSLPLLEADAVFLDQNLTSIKGTKTFAGGIEIHGNMDANEINGIDLRSSLLSKTTPQEVMAPYFFDTIVATNAQIGTFNNIDLNVLKDLKRKKEIVIEGSYSMPGPVKVNTLEVLGLVEGKNLSSVLGDAIQRDDDLIKLTGAKSFEYLVMSEGEISFINGLNVKKILSALSETLDDDDVAELIVRGNTTAAELVANSIHLSEDSYDIFKYLNDNFKSLKDAHTEDLEFVDMVVGGKLEIQTLNGIPHSDYLTKDTEQTIHQTVAVSRAFIRDLQLKRKIGGVYPSVFTHDKETSDRIQTYQNPIKYNGDLHIQGDLTVGSLGISKIKIPDDVIQLHNKRQLIKGNVEFTSPVSSKWIKSSTAFLNSVNLATVNESFVKINQMMQNQYGIDEMQKPSKVQLDNYLDSWRRAYKSECQRLSIFQSMLSKTVTLSTLDLVYNHRFSADDSTYLYDLHHYIPEYEPFNSDMPILIFEAFSQTWMVVPSIKDCMATLFSWSEVQRRFVDAFRLHGVGNVHQWLTLDDQGSILLLAVSSDNSCSGGSPLWKFSSADTEPMRVKELRPADAGFKEDVKDGIKVYLNSAKKTHAYLFNNGYLNKEVVSDQHLYLLRSFEGINGTRIHVRNWDGNYEITLGDYGISFEGFYTHDVIAIVDDDKVVLITYGRIVMSKRTEHYLYVLKTTEGHYLQLESNIGIKSPARLFSFTVTKRGFNHHFIVELQEFSTPIIYKLEDLSSLKKWAELPYLLELKPWAQTFKTVDAHEEHLYLVIGDTKKAIVLLLNWNSMNNPVQDIKCLV